MKCPICSDFDEKDNFTCPNCSRDNICGAHYDFDFLVCSDCASNRNKAIKQSEVTKEFAEKHDMAIEEDVEEEFEKNPFYIRMVKCPVCATPWEQYSFQLKTYSERNIDLDKHVQSFTWVDKAFERYHPPLYYMWFCFNCQYTDSYIEYEEPFKDPYSNFRAVKDAFIEQYQDDPRIEKVIDKLGQNIDYTRMNYYQAIKLHLLAIFIQELIENDDDKDALKLGRYYLRLGWLYRELEASTEEKAKYEETLKKLLIFLKKGWPEIAGNETHALNKAIKMLKLAFKTSHSIKSVVAEVDLLLLIAGIHIKLGEDEDGLKYYNQVLTRGQKTEQKINQRIKTAEREDKPLSPEETKRLELQLKKLGNLMNKGRDIISDLKAEKNKLEREKARAIIKTLGERPPLEIREILIKKGVDKSVAIKITPEPKKKFLGLF